MQKHCKILQYTRSFLSVKIVLSKIINIGARENLIFKFLLLFCIGRKLKKVKLLKITDEIINYQFIPMPNKLLHTKEYFKLSSNAKLVYILFLERLGLSKQNKLCNQKEEL